MTDASAEDREIFVQQLQAYGRGASDPPALATPRERAMLDYALALTRTPAAMTKASLAPMRRAGLDDRAILEANQVTAYFAYANRVADGLGIVLETTPNA